MRPLDELIRPNIAALEPYSSARDEYKGKEAHVFLDANENPYDTGYNRYPDPLQRDLKEKICSIKGATPANLFLGNGSDEAIDLMFRVFCRPGIDNVVAMEPSYGMYKVCANVNDIEYRAVRTNAQFQPEIDAMLAAADANTKLMFFCSPNNPSGNLVERALLERALKEFQGIVIIDEAYIDFASEPSFVRQLDSYPNLVVLQTFSKAWGLAGIRLGMAFAQPEIINVMNKVKYPYNVNQLTQDRASAMLDDYQKIREWTESILKERARMETLVSALPYCTQVLPSDANFILARMPEATKIYNYLVDNGIIVRNRSRIALCQDSLRITIGTSQENDQLIECLKKYNL